MQFAILQTAVGILARVVMEPRQMHLAALKRILGYLKGTADRVLIFRGNAPDALTLTGASDSDYAGDKSSRKSTGGYVQMLCGVAVAWKYSQQTCVALSSCEAEYMALTPACQQAISLRQLLEDVGAPQALPTSISVDNQSAISLASNPMVNDRSKHISIKWHWIRERCLEVKDVALSYIRTDLNPADAFTKPLAAPRLRELMHTVMGF